MDKWEIYHTTQRRSIYLFKRVNIMMIHKEIIGDTKYYYILYNDMQILGLTVKSLFVTLAAFREIEKNKRK